MSYEELKKEFYKKVELLRKNCKHEKLSDWISYHWAPGHSLGECKICLYCQDIIEKTWKTFEQSKDASFIQKLILNNEMMDKNDLPEL